MLKILKESVQKSDFIVWIATFLFFLFSAIISNGDIGDSLIGALGIIGLMFLVGFSIELILSALKNVKGLGEITGFITNGPEALVLIVGLISGNILFAASTPLGSNLMNPILLFLAIVVTGSFLVLKNFKYKKFYIFSFLLTIILALGVYYVLSLDFSSQLLSFKYFLAVVLISSVISIFLYFKNKKIMQKEEISEEEENISNSPKYFLPVGIILLLFSGYFLDPVVDFTASASNSPKGIIGFIVLSTLTSWPEFKTCLSLLKKGRIFDSFVNILVSNFSNIWLAAIGIFIYIFTI